MDATEASWLGLLEHARQMGPDPDLADLDDEKLEAQVRDGAARIAALTCRWLLHVAELVVRGVWADQHARTPGEWLSWACGTSAVTAREYVRVGLALRDLPRIRERFAAGTISYSKVRAITRVATPQAEEDLLHLADSAPASQLERIIAGCRRQMSAQEKWARGPEGDATEVRDFRRVEVDLDTVEFRVRVPLDDAAAFEQRVDRLAQLNDGADGGSRPPLGADTDELGDGAAVRAPLGVRRAIAVNDALAMAVAAAPPDRSGADDHLVVLHVDVDQLAAAMSDDARGGAADADTSMPMGASAETDASAETGAPVEPGASAETGSSVETAPPRRRTRGPSATGRRHVVTGRGRAMHVPNSVLAELTCDAELRLAGILDHDGHGHPADIGRRSRKVPPDLRRALQLRDRHCRFPGCHRTRRLHAHHVLHWARGGPTDMANLLLVCAFHHRVIHRQQWTMRPVDPLAGWWTFHAPDHDDPHPPVLPLPGASAEAATDIVEAPHPRSLQPPWWDGNAYDLNETIAVVVDALRDIRPPKVDRRPHPAMAARAA